MLTLCQEILYAILYTEDDFGEVECCIHNPKHSSHLKYAKATEQFAYWDQKQDVQPICLYELGYIEPHRLELNEKVNGVNNRGDAHNQGYYRVFIKDAQNGCNYPQCIVDYHYWSFHR